MIPDLFTQPPVVEAQPPEWIQIVGTSCGHWTPFWHTASYSRQGAIEKWDQERANWGRPERERYAYRRRRGEVLAVRVKILPAHPYIVPPRSRHG